MSGFYKSKEVYKHYRDSNGDPHITPVRGLYVGGEYTPPYYIDHNITITEINSTRCDAVEYTTAEYDVKPENILIATGYSSTSIDVIEYTNREMEMTEGILMLSSYSSSSLEITYYTTQEKDHNERILEMTSYSSTSPEYDEFSSSNTDLGHDYCITVTEVTSTPLVIQ